jgi:hypothetical protein
MENIQSFRVSPNVYLGHEYNSYKNKLFAHSISHPAQYLQLREDVERQLKTILVQQFYDVIFEALTEGNGENGNALITGFGLNETLRPHFPPQKVSEIALSGSATLDKFMDTLVEILLPINYNKIVENTLATQAVAEVLRG